jgi:hypothetical protein
MNPEDRKLLEAVHGLAVENRALAKKLVRAERWRWLGSVLKWVLVLGLAGWLYVKIEPFLRQVAELYQTLFPGLQLPF